MIHVHCHAKSLANSDYMYQLATRMPQADGDDARSGLLAWRARLECWIEIQTFGESRRRRSFQGHPEPAVREHRGGVRHKLPASKSNTSRRPHAAHGGSAGLKRWCNGKS